MMSKRIQSVPRTMRAGIRESAAVVESLLGQVRALDSMARLLVRTLKRGGTVLAAGNGGSAAEAMHLAEELTGRYRSDRKALPAVALAADGTALTCIANDFGFDRVFSRQVEALGRSGDLLVAFSTSGNSANLISAVQSARRRRMRVIALLGRGGGALAGRADIELVVESNATARIQEAHQVVLHLLLEAVEAEFGI
jgi:D-sedoheptulose 7-phosphate isomerase